MKHFEKENPDPFNHPVSLFSFHESAEDKSKPM